MKAEESQFQSEVAAHERFEFGKNWSKYTRTISESKISRAERSLQTSLSLSRLDGYRFLDIGSGSGLFSLAAWRLGAEVVSFDFDPQSVECTNSLREQYGSDSKRWAVIQGSVLDQEFLKTLGSFDVIYTWGVLHHTGDMWRAIENVIELSGEGNRHVIVALYNDQGAASRRWRRVKLLYNRLPNSLRWVVVSGALIRLWGPTTIKDLIKARPFYSWRSYSEETERGMSPWRDVIDWVGGLPFEVATRDSVITRFQESDYRLTRLSSAGAGHGCNEFVFTRENLRKPTAALGPADS